ncbi:aldose epimerase family protein [Clostridium fallax]|uniref:Aldose 1-epimerase n=1 Tax=Clostridium fallax TaxID=1533 RepID=A0A1M4XS58_9CLOT|nr:aldose epimerase family protein [Clostridium fallax]SHE96301.1 aldose 1-epimerase [Clostridium fallax]SQB08063.1 aldose 1-epimerase [Clostridium fallax]
MRFEEKVVGKIKGKDVVSYTLTNDNGMKVSVLNYGGIITDIIVPDKNNNFENIVLKFKDIKSYEAPDSYLGAIVGRTAGRISKGKFTINNKTYNLPINNGVNNLHGGMEGFSRRFWKGDFKEEKHKIKLTLSLKSRDGEEGFPGNLEVKVNYILDNSNSLALEYYGKSDKDTLVNMTNHSYFNLSGEDKENILNHKLKINSDEYLPLDDSYALKGIKEKVYKTPFDFKEFKIIEQDINKDDYQLNLAKGYDHPWILNNGKDSKVTLWNEENGRCMDVFTDNPSVVIYTANFGDKEVLTSGRSNETRRGICFETQRPSIGINEAFKEQSILRAEEEYKVVTIFKFYLR